MKNTKWELLFTNKYLYKMATPKRKITDYLDALVDKDGLKTEVTITLTNETMGKIILSLLASGLVMVTVSHLMKNFFPNRQLGGIQKQIYQIQKNLQK